MKILFIVTLLFAQSSFAYSILKIKITHPDKEEKTYSFIPTENEGFLKLKLSTKIECYLAPSMDADKKKFTAFTIECYPKKDDTKTGISSFNLCGEAPGMMKVQEPKKGAIELTVIVVKCE